MGANMAERRRGLLRWLMPWLVVFVMGVGLGYYLRDRQQNDLIEEIQETARREMESAGLEAIDRARRAGADLSAGAEAAAESTKAAFQRLIRGSKIP